MNITEKIYQIDNAMRSSLQARCHENEVLRPELTDFTLIHGVVGIFRSHIGREMNADDRFKLIFILQVLYAPRTLFGHRAPKGLRSAIERELLHVRRSTISRIFRLSLSRFRLYRSFRADVEHHYSIIKSWIENSKT